MKFSREISGLNFHSVRNFKNQLKTENYVFSSPVPYRFSQSEKLMVKILQFIVYCLSGPVLTLNVLIATNVICFSRLLKCLRCRFGKLCGPRSDCSV